MSIVPFSDGLENELTCLFSSHEDDSAEKSAVPTVIESDAVGGKKKTSTSSSKIPAKVISQLGLAHERYLAGDFSQSITLLSEVVRITPHISAPYHTLGIIYEECGDAMSSLQCFLLAAIYSKKDVVLWRKVLEIAMTQKQYTQALYSVNRLILLKELNEPDVVTLMMTKMKLLVLTGKLRIAHKMMKRLLLMLIASKKSNADLYEISDILQAYADACSEIVDSGRHSFVSCVSVYCKNVYLIMNVESKLSQISLVNIPHLERLVMQLWTERKTEMCGGDAMDDESLKLVQSNMMYSRVNFDGLFSNIRSALELLLIVMEEQCSPAAAVAAALEDALIILDDMFDFIEKCREFMSAPLHRYKRKRVGASGYHGESDDEYAAEDTFDQPDSTPSVPIDIVFIYGICLIRTQLSAKITSGCRLIFPQLQTTKDMIDVPIRGSGRGHPGGMDDSILEGHDGDEENDVNDDLPRDEAEVKEQLEEYYSLCLHRLRIADEFSKCGMKRQSISIVKSTVFIDSTAADPQISLPSKSNFVLLRDSDHSHAQFALCAKAAHICQQNGEYSVALEYILAGLQCDADHSCGLLQFAVLCIKHRVDMIGLPLTMMNVSLTKVSMALQYMVDNYTQEPVGSDDAVGADDDAVGADDDAVGADDDVDRSIAGEVVAEEMDILLVDGMPDVSGGDTSMGSPELPPEVVNSSSVLGNPEVNAAKDAAVKLLQLTMSEMADVLRVHLMWGMLICHSKIDGVFDPSYEEAKQCCSIMLPIIQSGLVQQVDLDSVEAGSFSDGNDKNNDGSVSWFSSGYHAAHPFVDKFDPLSGASGKMRGVVDVSSMVSDTMQCIKQENTFLMWLEEDQNQFPERCFGSEYMLLSALCQYVSVVELFGRGTLLKAHELVRKCITICFNHGGEALEVLQRRERNNDANSGPLPLVYHALNKYVSMVGIPQDDDMVGDSTTFHMLDSSSVSFPDHWLQLDFGYPRPGNDLVVMKQSYRSIFQVKEVTHPRKEASVISPSTFADKVVGELFGETPSSCNNSSPSEDQIRNAAMAVFQDPRSIANVNELLRLIKEVQATCKGRNNGAVDGELSVDRIVPYAMLMQSQGTGHSPVLCDLLAGHDCVVRHKYGDAFEHYLAALTCEPQCFPGNDTAATRGEEYQPVTQLCLSSLLILMASRHSESTGKYEIVVKAISFLVKYVDLRTGHIAHLKKNGDKKINEMYAIVIKQEMCFNLARSLAELGLAYLALPLYEQVLAKRGAFNCAVRNSSSATIPADTDMAQLESLHSQFSRLAAHNLVVMHRQNSNVDMAIEIMRDHLSFPASL